MPIFLRIIAALLFVAISIGSTASSNVVTPEQSGIPILVYHRFGSRATDAMTMTTAGFEEQMAWLKTHRYQIIELRDLVEGLHNPAKRLPSHAVSITVDDGNESIYRELFPLIRRSHIPVTLFVYPSAISNAKYALTWDQLAEMKRTGLVDVQSHTWWHPNFNRERARLSQDAYRAFVMTQLLHSKELIHRHLGGNIDMLAWPYGIHDPELQRWASGAGYVAAFTLVRRAARRDDSLLALPRYLVTDRDRHAQFAAMIEGGVNRTGRP
jgi:peptidoglycan/xylan/chitin deacetylase (PgdA/CDA1 family)